MTDEESLQDVIATNPPPAELATEEHQEHAAGGVDEAGGSPAPGEVVEGEEEAYIPVEQVMLKGLMILSPRQSKNADSAAAPVTMCHAVALPPLRAEEPVQSLRGALVEVVGFSHLTNFRFEVIAKPAANVIANTPIPIISPYTGTDASVTVPQGMKSLRPDILPSPEILDEFGNLTRLVEQGWHDKEAAFEIVLERYDLAGIKDHVQRLRSILAGNAPAVTSLLEDDDVAGTDPAQEEEEGGGGGNGGPENEEKKQIKPLPPLPRDGPILKLTANEPINLSDFFYRVNGEDRDKYNGNGRNLIQEGGKGSKKKKKSKTSNNKSGKEVEDDDAKEDALTPEGELKQQLTRWNQLDEETKVPFTVRYSGFHPPSASRRLMGDLAYLQLVPVAEEGHTENGQSGSIHITATPMGFYINRSTVSKGKVRFDPSPAPESCFSHALLDCLLKASSGFFKAWEKALAASHERVELMKQLNKDTALSFFRIAVRGDFPGFQTAAAAAQSVQHALDSSLTTPSWLVPRPTTYPGADSETAWTGNQFHGYSVTRVEEDLMQTYGVEIRNGGSRDWNEELQMAREMPATTLPERIERARLLHKVMTEFGEASLHGVKAIHDGHIAPMNPNEGARSQVFLHNNIFFSRALDSSPETFKIAQGDKAARKAANRDIQCISTLHRSEKTGLYTLATVLIDYLGTRYVCQSIIPGILIGEKSHTLLYGAVETGVPLKWDAELHTLLKESVAEPMMIATRKILRLPLTQDRMDEVQKIKETSPFFAGLENKTEVEKVEPNATIETCIPIEAKGILGSDQRRYLLDFGRLTPRDANWLPETKGGTGRYEAALNGSAKGKSTIPSSLDDDEWTMHVLRPELVSRFTQYAMATYMHEKKIMQKQGEKVDKIAKETTDAITRESETKEVADSSVVDGNDIKEDSPITVEPKAKEEKKGMLSEEDLAYMESLRLNINVFLPHMKQFEGIDDEYAKQMRQDENKVREVASFLWDDILPKITRAIRDGTVPQVPLDGRTLTEFLHRNGVNCRYLGRLAFLAREEEVKDEQVEAGLKQGTRTIIERKKMPRCWLDLLECEMVARASKHVLDRYLTENGGVAAAQPSQTIGSFLSALVSERVETAAQTEARLEKRESNEPDEDDFNSLTLRLRGGEDESGSGGILGRYEVWQDIEAEVGRRFRYRLLLFNNGNKSGRALYIPLLRRFCQRTGIRLAGKDYDVGGSCICNLGSIWPGGMTESYPISQLDVIDIVPLMKHAAAYNEGFTPCSVGPTVALPALQVSLRDARIALERAHVQVNIRSLGKGLELAQEAASLYQRVTENASHPGVIESIELMANIFLEAGDPEMAAANGAKVLALAIQNGGFDTANVFTSHMTLFQMFYAGRELDRALKHLHAALYILEIMAGPRHTECFTAYHKLGSVYSNDDYEGKYLDIALKFMQEAVKRESCDRLMDGIVAKSLAKILSGVGDYKEAVEAEKKAYQILSMFLSQEHQLSKESDTDLKNYTKLAVQQGSRLVSDEKIKEEEAKAEAVAAALAAEEEKERKKLSGKKKKVGKK